MIDLIDPDMIDALEAVKAFITARLAAELTVLETLYTVTVPRWAKLATSEDFSLVFPLIEILPGESKTEYGNGQSPYNETVYYEVHSMTAEIVIAGSDPVAVQAQLLYYRKALRRIFRADPTCAGAFENIRLNDCPYSRLMQSQKEKSLLKALSQALIARVKKT